MSCGRTGAAGDSGTRAWLSLGEPHVIVDLQASGSWTASRQQRRIRFLKWLRPGGRRF